MFDAFTQLFRRCGPGTPNQKKMLCGCTPTNPEHHVRHSVDIEFALKAKDHADGTTFMKGVSASKIHDILARFGVETKASAISPNVAEKHGFGRRSFTAKSILFGWIPIHQGSGAAGVAATASATGAAAAGAAATTGAAGGAAGGAVVASGATGGGAGGAGANPTGGGGATSTPAGSSPPPPLRGTPNTAPAPAAAGGSSATPVDGAGDGGGGGGAATMAGGVASGGVVASSASPFESYKDPVPCGARCGKECERGTCCTCGALANGRQLRQIERQEGEYEDRGSEGFASDYDEGPADGPSMLPPPVRPAPTTPVGLPGVQNNAASTASQHTPTVSNMQPGSSSSTQLPLRPFQLPNFDPPPPQLVAAMAGKVPPTTGPAADNVVSPMTGGDDQHTTSKANGVSPVPRLNLGGGGGSGSSSDAASQSPGGSGVVSAVWQLRGGDDSADDEPAVDGDALVNGIANWQDDYNGGASQLMDADEAAALVEGADAVMTEPTPTPSPSGSGDGAAQLMEADQAAALVGDADADRVEGADAEMTEPMPDPPPSGSGASQTMGDAITDDDTNQVEELLSEQLRKTYIGAKQVEPELVYNGELLYRKGPHAGMCYRGEILARRNDVTSEFADEDVGPWHVGEPHGDGYAFFPPGHPYEGCELWSDLWQYGEPLNAHPLKLVDGRVWDGGIHDEWISRSDPASWFEGQDGVMTFPDGTQLEYVDYGASDDKGVPFDPDFSGRSPPPSGSKRPTDDPFDEEDEPAKWYRQVDYEDALNYISRVEAEVPALHQQFLELLMEFKAQAIDRPHVIERVRQLFHGHDDLILAFNVFLPLGHHLQVRCATTAGAVPDAPFQCPHTHTNL